MIWLILLAALGVVLAYIFLVRPVLVNAPILSTAFKAEQTYFTMLRVKLVGWKTKIAARGISLAGVMVYAYDELLPIVSGQDWTPLNQKLPVWVVPVGLVFIGWLFSYLRKVTENPPQVITQKTDDGTVHVVAVNLPQAAS